MELAHLDLRERICRFVWSLKIGTATWEPIRKDHQGFVIVIKAPLLNSFQLGLLNFIVA